MYVEKRMYTLHADPDWQIYLPKKMLASVK